MQVWNHCTVLYSVWKLDSNILKRKNARLWILVFTMCKFEITVHYCTVYGNWTLIFKKKKKPTFCPPSLLCHQNISRVVYSVNARTVHKLQGRSLENLFLSTLDYTDNWIYVALSRVKTLKGLFLRKPLLYSKVRGMSQECIDFHTLFRKINSPKQIL